MGRDWRRYGIYALFAVLIAPIAIFTTSSTTTELVDLGDTTSLGTATTTAPDAQRPSSTTAAPDVATAPSEPRMFARPLLRQDTSPRGFELPPPVTRVDEAITVTPPASDLAQLVATNQAGASFYFPNGEYRFNDVEPKDGMTFIGESTDGVIINGDGQGNAFHGVANDVSIANMTFRNFNGDSGVPKRQEQSPIRGTADIWHSDRGAQASGWLIENIVSEGGYAAGVFVGDNFVVRNSVLRNNGVTGIAGDDMVGGLFYGNEIYGNGEFQADGALVNGGGVKLTQAGTPADPVILWNNDVHDNTRSGIWCDLGCEGFFVYDNNIYNHEGAGIVLELSRNVQIAGNTLTDNNSWTDFNHNFNGAAIKIAETKDVVVEDNHVTGSESGVIAHHAIRPDPGNTLEEQIITLERYPTLNFDTDNVTIRNNRFTAVSNIGISTGTTGRINNPASISFEGNTYDSPDQITFWWINKQTQNYDQWTRSGRQ